MSIIIRIYLIIIVVVFIGNIKYFNDMAATPLQLYECNNLNWIGIILLYLFVLIFDPIFFLLRLLRWLITFGRKE